MLDTKAKKKKKDLARAPTAVHIPIGGQELSLLSCYHAKSCCWFCSFICSRSIKTLPNKDEEAAHSFSSSSACAQWHDEADLADEPLWQSSTEMCINRALISAPPVPLLEIQGKSEEAQWPNEEALGLFWWCRRGTFRVHFLSSFKSGARNKSHFGKQTKKKMLMRKALICLFAFLFMQKFSLQVQGSRRASVMRYPARCHILNVSPQSKRRTRASLKELKEFQMIKHLLFAAQVRGAQELCSNVKSEKKGRGRKKKKTS